MNEGSQYDADYFLRGKESGKSLYENYRYLPELTIPMVQTIIEHCNIQKGARVLDYGCARGYTVKTLRGLGYEAYGYDISEWAVQNSDPQIRQCVTTDKKFALDPPVSYEWIIAKDVLEHVRYVKSVVVDLMKIAEKGLFVVVPLSKFDNSPYVINDYEKDTTHIQRYTLGTWVNMFLRTGWVVEASYRMKGVKDNWWKSEWKLGNGFITARRIEE